MIVSDQDSAENAVACMKAGATDYILKNKLALLPEAVVKATCNARFGQQNKAACYQQDDTDRPRSAGEDTNSGIWDWNIVSNEVAFSHRLEVMLGFENSGPGNRFQEWKSRIHPDDKEAVMEKLSQHLENKTPVYKSKYRILTKNGTYSWISDQGKVLLRSKQGPALRMAGTSTDISELKIAESKLRDISETYNAITRNVGLAVVSVSGNGNIESINLSAEAMLGYKAHEVIGQRASLIFRDAELLKQKASELGLVASDEESPDYITLLKQFTGPLPPSFEWALIGREGKKIPVLLSVTVLRNELNHVTGFIGVAVDISARKEAEEVVKNSEQRFHNMFENHDAMMFLVEPATGMVISANRSGRNFYGYDFSAGINIKDINTLSEEELKTEMSDALAENRNFFAFNHRLANGKIRSVDVHSTPIEVNNKVLLFSILRDVTDKRLAEKSLNSITLRLSTLLINMQSGILFEDETRHVTLANQMFCDIFDIQAPPAALFGADCEQAAIGSASKMKDPETFLKRIHEILQNKAIVLCDEIEFADGSVYERDYIPIMLQDELMGHLWQYRNITIRKTSQEALRWNESLLRFMANSSPLAFFVVDNRTDKIIYFNHRFCEIWGISHLEAQMRRGELSNSDIIPDCLPVLADIAAFAESCKPLQDENNRITIEDLIPFNDDRFIRRFSTQIRGDQDEYYGRLYLFEDITDQKQNEFFLGLQRDLGIGLSSVSTLPDTLNLAIDALIQTGIVDRGGIYLINTRTGNLELSVHRNIPESYIPGVSIYTPESTQFKLVMEGKPVFGPYPDIIGANKRVSENESFRYITILPIFNEGKILGNLNLGSLNTADFSIKKKHTLEAFANQIGIAIARIGAEAALRKSQQNFHLMFDTLDDFMFILDMHGNIIKTNPVVQKRLGYTEAELCTMHVLDCHPSERREEAGTIVNEMLTGKSIFCPVPLIAKDGTLIPVETRVMLGKWDEGNALYGISRDITERRKAENELQLRESFLSAVINNHPGLFWLKDTLGKYILINNKNFEYLTVNNLAGSQSLIGRTDFDYLPAEVARKYQAEDQTVIETRQPLVNEEFIKMEKSEAWYEIFKFPVVDKNGYVIGVSGYSIDITERKKSESKLRMQNAAFESFTLAMMITDSDGIIQWVNPAFTSLTGYHTDEVIGHSPSFLHSGKQDKFFLSVLMKTIRSGEVWSGELQNRKKDGTLYFEEQTITPVYDEQGEISNFIAIKIDITHRKEIEEALRQSEQRWQFALEGSGDGIWDWNAETNTVFFSKQWKAMLGYENDEIGNTLEEWSDRIHPDDSESCFAILEEHINGETEVYVSEHRMRCKDGSYKWILDRGKIIEWLKKGKPLRFIGTHSDTTSRKTLEETLKKGIEKERELNDLKSRFVSTTSHEFRTPLASILIISDSLVAYWEKMDKSQVHSRLEKIKEQILHLSSIVNDVLQLSRIQEGKIGVNLEKTNIVGITRSIIESFNADEQLKSKIQFQCLQESVVALLDERLITQVLNNLISNAIKYSPENPEICISIEEKQADIWINIQDNGIGIPVEEHKYLFTPFYRASNTKNIHGNGLGLNIVRESTRLQGGDVTFESMEGKGSVFHVLLHRITNSEMSDAEA
jgi:PAS domain S-box-containing protein